MMARTWAARCAARSLSRAGLNRGGADAVGAGAEIDAVEVDLEQLVLGEFVLEPERQQRLLHLARQGPVGRQEQVLGELLADGAAALDDAAGAVIDVSRAGKPDRVDAEMVVEAAILGGDHGRRQIGRQVPEAQRLAEQIAIGGDDAAVGAEDGDAWPAGGHGQIADRRQGERKIGGGAAAEDHAPEDDEQRDTDEAPLPAPPRELGAAAPLAAGGALRPILRVDAQVGASTLCYGLPQGPNFHSTPPLAQRASLLRL